MNNGQNVARSRHLEELARAAKRYTLQEILDVTEAIAAELDGLNNATYENFTGATSTSSGLSGLVPAPEAGDEFKFLRGDGLWAVVESGGSSYSDFTGATSITGGLSGLVPAPEAGDEEKFLRGDGTWATVESGGASVAVFTGATTDNGTSGLVPAPRAGDNGKFLRGDGTWATVESGSAGGAVDYVIGSKVSGVEGGFWQSIINDAPVLKLRHGDYEYNFAYDNITYLGGASSVLETVTPNTYVLGTASVSNDGGVWYEVNNNVPTLNLHAGNFNYSFNYDSVTYKGSNSHLAAYLPFNVSPTADACGNVWTATGNPTIVDGKLYLNNTSSLTNTTIADSIGSLPWTSDCWFSCGDTANVTFPHRFQLSGGNTAHSIIGSCIAGNAIGLNLGDVNQASGIAVTANTRYHCALTYDGTTLRLFVNGVLAVTNEFAVQLGGSCSIGLPSAGVTIDHLRVFKGQALWTENFTPPTAEDYL